jgi:hypothetical protein
METEWINTPEWPGFQKGVQKCFESFKETPDKPDKPDKPNKPDRPQGD